MCCFAFYWLAYLFHDSLLLLASCCALLRLAPAQHVLAHLFLFLASAPSQKYQPAPDAWKVYVATDEAEFIEHMQRTHPGRIVYNVDGPRLRANVSRALAVFRAGASCAFLHPFCLCQFCSVLVPQAALM